MAIAAMVNLIQPYWLCPLDRCINHILMFAVLVFLAGFMCVEHYHCKLMVVWFCSIIALGHLQHDDPCALLDLLSLLSEVNCCDNL